MIQNSRLLKLASCALATIVFLSNYAQAQRGALTISRGLDQLSEEADVIVRGHVASARVEPHPQLKNLMTVVISFTVQDTLKGKPQKSIEFRQYIWDLRDQLDAARYVKGEELLLMLGPVSHYGLRSPVGLDQGRFRITRDQQGRAVAVNARGNVGLFQSVEQRSQTRGLKLSTRQMKLVRQPEAGPVALEDLEDAIRTFAGTK